jgi:hypothetical protein
MLIKRNKNRRKLNMKPRTFRLDNGVEVTRSVVPSSEINRPEKYYRLVEMIEKTEFLP